MEVQCEVSEQIKIAKEKKEQNRKGNEISGSGGGNNENKQHNKDGQCTVPIADHRNHKWKDCK